MGGDGIDFDGGRWEKVREDSARFWARETRRPFIQMKINGGDYWGVRPAFAGKTALEAMFDFSIPVSAIVDYYAKGMERERHLGDGFPNLFPNLGPGVFAAFAGARAEAHPATVWFGPREETASARDLSIRYEPGNALLRRLKEFCAEGHSRWNGIVQIAMTDLGGNLDIVSTLRPGERLLLDLYDAPEEVRRLTWETHEAWWKCFDDINGVLHGPNPGYSTWCPAFSTEPCYILQCDFSYMISPEMFDEFVKPEIQATCRRLGNSLYHLDGVGSLPHLASLLSIPELDAIQWVPGKGKPGPPHWIDVYRRIRDAGKVILFDHDFEDFDAVAGALGSAEGILYTADSENEAEAREFLAKYGVK